MNLQVSGFAPYKAQNIVVEVTQTTSVSPQLSLAGAVEKLNVTADAPLLNTDSATTGRVVNEQAVQNLPLPTRNFQQLLALSLGTNAPLAVSNELGR